MEQMKMVQMAAGLAPLKTSKPMGNHAKGETGRKKADQGVEHVREKLKPANHEAKGNANNGRQAKTHGHTF